MKNLSIFLILISWALSSHANPTAEDPIQLWSLEKPTKPEPFKAYCYPPLAPQEKEYFFGEVDRFFRESPSRNFSKDPWYLKHGYIAPNFGQIPYLSTDWQLMKQNSRGEIAEECRPKVLYSWGSLEKIHKISKEIGLSSSWPKRIRMLFLAHSPISTFGYGPLPIRVKLMEKISYKRVGDSGDSKVHCVLTDALIFRRDSYYSDYVICRSFLIHSWSFGTKEHYNEMIEEYKRVEQNEGSPYGNFDVYSITQFVHGTVFMNYLIDSQGPYSKEKFKENLVELLGLINTNQGKIFFNPDLPDSEKTAEKHFE